jgi:hypothetical protein
MGALWGALGGAADAAKEVYGKKQDAEIAEAKATADEARAMRLERMRQKYRTSEAGAEREFKTGERESEQEFEAGESKLERGHKSFQKEADRQQDAVQTDKEIEGRQNVADTRAEATMAASGKTKAGFKSVKIKSSVMTEDGFEEKEVPIVFQESSGRYFQDNGGQLVPYQLEQQLEGPQLLLFQHAGKWPKEALKAYMKTAEGKRLGIPAWYELTYGKQS